MSAISADNLNAWQTRQEHPAALEIILLKQTYVLPWVQFLYAEGGGDEVRIAFATHDVIVCGARLQSLLTDVAAQRLARLHEPARPDQFETGDEPCIREVHVSSIEKRR